MWPSHAWSIVTGRGYGLVCLSNAFGHAGGYFIRMFIARDANVRLHLVDVNGLPAACN
jgi:hypothetical protein